MTNFYKLLIASAIIPISSCNLFNPVEPIPSYIHIDKYTVLANPAGYNSASESDEVSLSSKISDAWVYVDDQLVGCYELPVTFPVLSEGVHSVKIRPGIKVNGIAATRAPYPFLSEYKQTVDLQKGTKTTLTPTTMYLSNTTFKFMENFEHVGTQISPGPGAYDTIIKIVNTPASNVYEGSSSGIVNLDNVKTVFECSSNSYYNLPKSSIPVFLEFDYKCNYTFQVGMYANSTQMLILNMNVSPEWNKAYIYLTPTLSLTSTSLHKVFFSMLNTTSADNIQLLIDNIRIVY